MPTTFTQSVSHQEHGVNDITITSPQNPLFVIHDSASFQLGRVSGFEEVKGFIQSRSGNGVAFQDQVHAIWCVASARAFIN
jgi:hypothetical protein